jgi:hypothetical protein
VIGRRLCGPHRGVTKPAAHFWAGASGFHPQGFIKQATILIVIIWVPIAQDGFIAGFRKSSMRFARYFKPIRLMLANQL